MNLSNPRRQEIYRITSALEGEKQMIDRRLDELYKEDEELWKSEQARALLAEHAETRKAGDAQ